MRLTSAGLVFHPPPPSATGGPATSVSLVNFHYRGSVLRQQVTSDAVTYELVSAESSAAPLVLEAGGQQQTMKVGVPIAAPRGKAAIMPAR